MSKELREKIPVINFMMMFEVMLYHCLQADNDLAVSAADLWWNQLYTKIIMGPLSSLCMSTFFAITGFLLFYNLSFQNLGKKLKSRVWTLLIPYILWQIIYIVKSMLQGNSWTLGEMFAQTFLLRLWPPLGAFWYVYTVFLFALFSPVFLMLFRNEKIGWLSTVVLIILLYVFWNSLYIGNGKQHYTGNIKSFFPAYLIGAFYGHIYDESTIFQKLKYLVGYLLIAVLFDEVIGSLFSRMAISVLPMFVLFLLPVPEWTKNRNIYRLSFLIYATHQSIISLALVWIRPHILDIIPYISVANILWFTICIVIIIAVNAVIHAVMNRFTPRTLRLLTGGRC